MASPEEVAHFLPETLPEDFSEWDGEASSAPLPGSSGETSKPLSPPAARGAAVAPGVGRPRGARSTWSGPELPKPQELPGTLADQVSRSVSYRLEPSRRFGESNKPQAQSGEREPMAVPAVERPRLAPSPAPAPLKEQRLTGDSPDRSPSRSSQWPEPRSATVEVPVAPSRPTVVTVNEQPRVPEPKTAAMTDAAIVELFRGNVEVEDERKSGNKKRVIIVAVSACAILLLLIFAIPLFHHGVKSAASQSVQPLPAVTNASLTESTPKPSAGKSFAHGNPSSEKGTQPSADGDSAGTDEEADSTPDQPGVQTAMMNEQLTAQARIPHETKNEAPGSAPPPVNFGAYGLGGNKTNGSIFNGHSQSVVQAPPTNPVAVASGIANEMLLRKTTPIYPIIAKEARISGTVVLEAVVSKAGTVKDLRVLSGPAMLRQSAIDAVRTWRYKPYQFNNQPVEMETTISVLFSLGD